MKLIGFAHGVTSRTGDPLRELAEAATKKRRMSPEVTVGGF